MIPATKEEKLARIAQIDRMFEEAAGWGSWMATASGERAGLVYSLAKWNGVIVKHKFQMAPRV